jgi:nicotinate-nucleotide--dimethylbenzimidazole phosphoribosyltransferase
MEFCGFLGLLFCTNGCLKTSTKNKFHKMLRQYVESIRPPDKKYVDQAIERHKALTKPVGSLGFLEELGVALSGIYGSCPPNYPDPGAVIVFAGDHGVVQEKVTPWPQEVSAQMVHNFLAKGAAINAIADSVGCDVYVVDMGLASDIGEHIGLINKKVGYGTKNIYREPAMSINEAEAAVYSGIEVTEDLISRGYKCIAVGDMGIGNTTPSSSVIGSICKLDAERVTGRGTGIDDEMLNVKTKVVEAVLKRTENKSTLEILAEAGGYEIAGLTGSVLAAAKNRIPVVVDGVISLAGAILAYELCPDSKDYMFAGHLSSEPAAKAALDYMGLRPILNLDMRLGEGTGATLAISVLKAAASVLINMATFDSAGVSRK